MSQVTSQPSDEDVLGRDADWRRLDLRMLLVHPVNEVVRFLPALVRREGFDIVYVDVIDRPRRSGVSNYGFFDRLWVGLMDLTGVWWLIRRKKSKPVATEVR